MSVDGVDVSQSIRASEVADAVSRVAAVPEVRTCLVARQRALVEDAAREEQGVVMEGRDIGTVVLPDADLKIYLTADVSARAERRALQDADSADASTVERAQANLESRDSLDSSRAVSPLQQAADAVAIDGTALTLDEVIDAVVAAVPADRP